MDQAQNQWKNIKTKPKSDNLRTIYNVFRALKSIIPDSLIDHFDAISTTNTKEALHLYSEENTKPPQEFNSTELVPKSFLNEITTHYLPSRGKFMHLHIKRRRWANKSNMGITKID